MHEADASGIARAAELIERDACLDLFAAASPRVAEQLGLSHEKAGGVGLLASRAVPITEFNRAMAVGTQGTLSDDAAAVSWLNAHAAPSWALQIAPGAIDADGQASLDQHRLGKSGNGWAKFTRPGLSPAPRGSDVAAKVDIADAASAEAYGRTAQAGFSLPEICAEWFAALVGRTGWLCFLARVGGTPAGAGALFLHGGSAWFGIDTVLPDHRRRGLHSALIAERIDAAVERGATVLTAETGRPESEDAAGFSSYRNYKRAGFGLAYVRLNFKRSA